jgi:circadian clock protein KaiC
MKRDLAKLDLKKKVLVGYVRVERPKIEETGTFDLEGLCIRLGHAVDPIHAPPLWLTS